MTDWIAANVALVITLVKILFLLFILLTAIAYVVWFERKLIAHIQARWGPYRVGPHGLLQPLADGIKFILKEDITPANVTSRFLFLLAPFLGVSLALLAVAVIPFGPGEVQILGTRTGFYIADINIALLFVLGVTSLTVYSVALAGWSSNSKYPLLGALRSSAQMISYELALTLSVIGVLLLANTLSLREIVAKQGGPFWHWYFVPQFVAFLCFFISSLAETNRSPFDLAEAESELVAGFHTEYSSMKFAMFFMAEYAHMFTASFLATILFFGGWLSPFPDSGAWVYAHYLPVLAAAGLGLLLLVDAARSTVRLLHRLILAALGSALLGVSGLLTIPVVLDLVRGPFWFIAKVIAFVFVFVWVRATLPRFRYDQLMDFGWKFLLPLAAVNIIATSLWIVWRAN
ncbi:MAG TPA: NADH-quinone oxidoreductase subunit NuoH [Candidatus Acidoferrales bacterium]|nr:NADH-quinone oxidoreductase subunit NuoH [Candidatus Acidoferrales bacterium]